MKEVSVLFDMKKVGKRIVELRKENKITQMVLADLLGVSFQAISNWERGETMPDISKLPELSRIFNVSIDDILSKSKGTQLVKDLVESDDFTAAKPIDKEEFINVAPILTLEQADQVYRHIEGDLSSKDLSVIAPYLSQDIVNDLAKKEFRKSGLTGLACIAPYISQDILVPFAEKEFELHGLSVLTVVAPFLGQEMIDESAKKELESIGLKGLTSMAPFISQEVIDEGARKEFELNGLSALSSVAYAISEDVLSDCAQKSYETKGIQSLASVAPFIKKELLEEIALDAISKKGISEVISILPFIDQNLIKGMVFK